MGVKVISAVVMLAGLGALVWALEAFSRLTVWGRIVVPIGVLLSVFGGLDGIQKRYVFGRTAVRTRTLFFWRTRALPPNVRIAKDPYGRILLCDALAKRQIMSIGREFNRRDTLLAALKTFFGSA